MSGLIKFESQTVGEIMKLAEQFAQTDLVPKEDKGKPANVLVKWQYGAEIGLSPMLALQSISVINGRPCVWGDGLLALVQGHKDCVDIQETLVDGVAKCVVKRIGRSDTVATFSYDDAKRAGLLGKQGPWSQYPERMLKMRARGFALRDAFSDVLKGIKSAEEVMDYEVKEKDITPRSVTASLASSLTTKVAELPEDTSNAGNDFAPVFPTGTGHYDINELLAEYVLGMKHCASFDQLKAEFARAYKDVKSCAGEQELAVITSVYNSLKAKFFNDEQHEQVAAAAATAAVEE